MKVQPSNNPQWADNPPSDVGKGLLICKTLSSQILHFAEVGYFNTPTIKKAL